MSARSRAGTSMTQEEINRTAGRAREARAGVVVRLKGGDPFVFGRGGEEAEALAEAGVPFEVVPGVTAGVAAPAYAGHPGHAPRRGLGGGVRDGARGSRQAGERARLGGAGRVPRDARLLHGRARAAARVAAALVEHGRAPTEPAAVVERGTLPGQRTVTGTLERDRRRWPQEAGIRAPAMTVVGPVAALRERLAWFERAPLLRPQRGGHSRAGAGERTGQRASRSWAPRSSRRPRSGSSHGSTRRRAGDAVDALGSGTLRRAVPHEPQRRRAADGRARPAAGSTRARWPAPRWPPSVRAPRPRCGSGASRRTSCPRARSRSRLPRSSSRSGVAGKRVLIARAAEARDVLPRELERGRRRRPGDAALRDGARAASTSSSSSASSDADYVTFTSSSTVRFLLEAIGGVERFPRARRVVSIGPVTSADRARARPRGARRGRAPRRRRASSRHCWRDAPAAAPAA